jgi:hypothetical protein
MTGIPTIVRLAILLLSFTPGPVGAVATLDESPTTAVPGGTVVVTWSGIDTPTPLDWIGLYVQGAQDEHSYDQSSWIYDSTCAQLRDPTQAGKASGECQFVLPGTLVPGVYELHILADDGYTRLARSDPFTVLPTGPIQLVSFNINNGAASTTSHMVTLNFTTAPTNTGDPSPLPDAFRAVEGGSQQELFAKPFVDLTSTTSAPFTLALKRRDGARYGGRPILLQVKSGSQLSFPRIDSIRLDPILREYTIGSDPVFDFARSQGYLITTTSVSFNPDLNDKSDPDDACNQCPEGSRAQARDQACTVTTTVIFFTGRGLRPFWRLKKVEPPVGVALPINQNIFRWILSDTTPPDPSLFSAPGPCPNGWFWGSCPAIACTLSPAAPPATLTFEGPTEDDFVDPLNPWKNAFTSFFRLTPIPIRPPPLR